jgi:two-component system sensor histidine kinase PilS (NtrC family)
MGVVTSDLSGHVTNINERARALAGVEGDVAGRPLRAVLSHAPTLLRPLEDMLREGKEFSGLDVGREAAVKPLSLRLDGHFLLSGEGERIGAILQIQDVSVLKLLDQEVRRTEKLAGLGTLAAGIAHEIKNPLAALSIHAQLLEESPEPAKAAKYLDVLRSEIRRLHNIVDKYVHFARPRPLEKSAVSVEALLESILALVEPECRKKNIRIERGGLANPGPRQRLDEGQMQQALLNIVINAIQAMDRGGVLSCRLDRTPDFLNVRIGDTGPGIPPEAKARLFELFYTTRQGGSGIGLYNAQRIVAEHKGFIDVSTGPDGSVFTLGLPAEDVA